VGVSTASCGGNVTSDGGAAVTSRGVCWSTSPNPTIADNNTSDSSGAGAFVSAITGLTTGTTYYVRAYATNIVGTGYGNQVSFTTQQLPILTTDTVMNIIDTSATFSGTIVAFGDATATVRGFCWGNSPDPDITTDSFSVDVNCTLGAFSQQVTTLVGGSIYYVRAYATSSLGTGYGQNVLFYTLGTPVVVADSVSGITTTTATYYGHVAFHGGDSVTSRGFCWSTFPNPTTADNVVTSGSGMGSFISNVAQLNPGTVYYVRAFATNMYGTGYSDNVVFSTVNPAFSVTPLRKIGFSTGNLQWSATGGGNAATSHVVAGGDTAAGTWRFATHQYDTIGTANSNISSSYNGWIDLFGWGTSGYDQRYPYLNTTSIYAYDNGNTDMSGTNYDWGTYNAILNGGNQPGQWFTLTKEEWEYLLNDREGASQKRGFATVCGVPGALLLPDSWSHPVGTSFVTGNGNGYATNTYNASQWAVMESYGAIFLPAAGYRYDSTAVQGVGAFGHYWTASADSATITYCLKLSPDRVDIEGYRNTQGKSVRLVRILSERPKVTTDSITSVTSNSVVIYGNILSTGRDSVTLCGFCWSTNPNPTTSDNVSSFFPNSPAVGSYSRNITNLVSGTKYYVRFFATNGDGISYGNEQIFTTTGYGISGRFSVSATTKVRIAHGNLQYTGWGTHLDFDGDTMRGRWQFAYNHYDKLGVAPNALISDTNSGSIDLFGWGTSGFQRMPTLSDVADSLYGNDSADIAYSRHDWGVNNQIYSMLRDEFYAPDTWRTLSLAEIDYLFVQRPSASSKVGLAMISGVNGLIILPDDWQQPSGINFVPTCAYGYAINTYTPSQWEMMADN
ncbi:MAG: hypothetical protein IKX51_08825, partial [Bacteroidales bacterium]|nr:hypothetical protein [Bacteroidales bacterium]